MDPSGLTIDWVVLTMGNRPDELHTAVASLVERMGPADHVVVVSNGGGPLEPFDHPRVRIVETDRNLGVPGGRHVGLQATEAPIVGFLDDDAEFRSGYAELADVFSEQADVGAVSLRLVDEDGTSNARHVPRPGGRDADRSGPVATFLGGACALRRSAYEEVGGYFTALQYGHEEVELSWRLVDAGWRIRYLADTEVFHPRTEIARHRDGWRLTGRNRVWIARRTLPWPIALCHVAFWLVLGVVRAPDAGCRRSYLSGWWSGWRTAWNDRAERRPISWRTVWTLTRLGRPPVV